MKKQWNWAAALGGGLILSAVATFALPVPASAADDTVLTIGWNQCSKWKPGPDGHIVSDFADEWDGLVPVFHIETRANGDISLRYNTSNEQGRVVKHGGFGWDMTFKPDETLEYWNMSEFEGKKDNVKFFRKLHGGDPKLTF